MKRFIYGGFAGLLMMPVFVSAATYEDFRFPPRTVSHKRWLPHASQRTANYKDACNCQETGRYAKEIP